MFKMGIPMRTVKKHGGARPGSGPKPGPPTKVVRLPEKIADFVHNLVSEHKPVVKLKPGDVAAFFGLESRLAARVPMMMWSAACGFPSPAEDYVDKALDFNELLVEHPAATFAIRIEGDSMTGAGIFPGDIAVVDRAREPVNGNIVLALLDGAFTIKRYRIKNNTVWLQAENPAFADMQITGEQNFEVWGVVTRSIRML